MNNEEAKFILSAYRASGEDAADKVFREALLQSTLNPDLGVWMQKQQEFDGAVARKLECLQPPASLADEILTVVRVNARRKGRVKRWVSRLLDNMTDLRRRFVQ